MDILLFPFTPSALTAAFLRSENGRKGNTKSGGEIRGRGRKEEGLQLSSASYAKGSVKLCCSCP